MAQNNKLKRRAQAFAAKHDVSYTVALKAVDEPLHELRDFIGDGKGEWYYGANNRFRIVPRQGSYGYAFSREANSRGTLDEEFGLTRYDGSMAFLRDLVRRHDLFEAASVDDIWEYRELYRAGLLGKDAEPLEPFFHHYHGLLSSSYSQMQYSGHSHGIFPVNIAKFLKIEDRDHSIPVTLDQLRALSEGRPVGPIEKIFQVTEFNSPASHERAIWTDSYRIIASSKASYTESAKLTIFFKRDLEALHEELRSRDLDPEDFTFEELPAQELTFSGTMIHFTVQTPDGEYLPSGGVSSYNRLLWD